MPTSHHTSHAALRDAPHHDRLVRLGRALIALSHELAECKRAVVRLERENRELRGQLRRASTM